ncbi:MAG: AAA domain-containing protein [Bdellovibrionota bacterium]
MSKRPKHTPPKPLKGEIASIISYWRDALIEGEHGSLNAKEYLALGLDLPFADLSRGTATAHAVRTLAQNEERRAREKERARARPSSPSELRVLLCPLRFERIERGPGPRFVEPLWIPAVLQPNGNLLPPRAGGPWIPREHLEPLLLDNAVTIGDSRSVERFADKYPANDWQSWDEYWTYSSELFRFVTGVPIESFELEEFRRAPNSFVTLDVSSAGSTTPLRDVMSSMLEGRRSTGLLPLFATRSGPSPKSYPRSVRSVYNAAIQHTGQFGDKFPLAPSQRLAVHRLLGTKSGDFLCVTGPPGTGKTTLLQSVIASLWISAIGNSDARPPIIVACGATNQSVTNVIDSLGRATGGADLFAKRWLPDVHSFGTFCCSATRARDIEGYQLELRDGTGISSEMETEAYVARATQHYLQCFSDWSGRSLTLKKVVSRLRLLVLAERSALKKDIFRARYGSFSGFLGSLVGMGRRQSPEELFQAVSHFDTTRRHKLFLLASHYWEGRWLLEAAAVLKRRASEEQKQTRARFFRGDAESWQRRAMITPAFVSTLAMTPRFFAGKADPNQSPIDLLIFDEAGQIPVEMGVACVALAKRAMVVGDAEQLEPVWNVAPHIDRVNAAKNKLVKLTDAAGWKAFAKRGLAASAGSLMELALRSTPWEERRADTRHTTHGVFLTEHRRSVPAIVQFCNRLAYGDRLEPCRPELAGRVLPPFCYVHVAGIAQQFRQSRYNMYEVHQIGAWIERHEAELKRFYRATQIDDVLAVITPFAAQTQKLKEHLRKRYPKMTIGTVNSLQGAERAVILFSSVYDSKFEGRYIFDQGTNMLNVAVSRAKDTFLVFGDMQIFKADAQAPSGVLAQFLFAGQAFELPQVASADTQSLAGEEMRRITTLEEHQEELFRAFQVVQNELLIVSPTISSAAILRDRIVDHIRNARSRNVRVRVFTDCYLDSPDGQLKKNAAEGRRLLTEAGATVHIAKAIHNKAVAIDSHTLIEGSFNWLSAVRTAGSIHQKLEVSSRYTGPLAAERIRTLLEELEHRERLLA